MIKRLILLTLVFCSACSRGSNESHYAQLEQNRNQQAQQQPAPAASAVPSPSPSPVSQHHRAKQPPRLLHPRETTGLTSVVQSVTAGTMKRPSRLTGRRRDCLCFGSNLWASGTPRSSSRT